MNWFGTHVFSPQALAIPTKITKGTIEIIKDVDIIKAGDRVGMSEATLLNMLKISPFSYGLVISKVLAVILENAFHKS